MRRLTTALLTVLLLAGSPIAPMAPSEARADDCIESCNEDFPGGSPVRVAMRGWCYIIRCYLL